MATKPSELAAGEMIKQGAEARVYRGTFFGRPCIIKERFKKTYRHPKLDERLTQRRLAQEAKSLLRCKKAGIRVPAVYFIDTTNNSIYLEDISESLTVCEFFRQFKQPYAAEDDTKLCQIAEKIGAVLALLHTSDTIHGDLTTSNMLLKNSSETTALYLIDFGLSQVSKLSEDKGVDLYVLEKAFLSTHPNTEHIFREILSAYQKAYRMSGEVIKKLDEVRLRGRKRVMIG